MHLQHQNIYVSLFLACEIFKYYLQRQAKSKIKHHNV